MNKSVREGDARHFSKLRSTCVESLSVPSFLYVSDSPLVSIERKKEYVPLRTAYSQNGRYGMQPKARQSSRTGAAKTRTETFELVEEKQKLLDIRKEKERERERCASRRYLLHIIVKLIYVLSQPIGDIIQNEAHDCQFNAYKVGIAKVASCLKRWRLCNTHT
ncbi:hypothetical protein TNCV_4359001 [Trichonephila clavipes]|nr:hypothetical protein TNCV_4359001 [Trichonephila clavipes]